MHLHLANCHGEWTALAVILAQAPLVGLWLRSIFIARKGD
jgi:hypothetical protein